MEPAWSRGSRLSSPPWNSRGLPYQGAKWSFYAQRQGGKYRPLVSCASECRKCAIKSHPITPKYTSKREALRKENVWPQTRGYLGFNKRYRINSFTILFPAKNAPRRPAPGGPVAIAGGHASTRQNTAFSTCSYGAYLPGPFALHSVWIVLRRCVGPW